MTKEEQFVVPLDAGRVLAALRKEAGRSQADVSRTLGIDTSKASRIETGDVSLTATYLQKFVDAIDTDSARKYIDYLKQPFRVLPQPQFNHPNIKVLSTADDYLQQLKEFVTDPDLPGPLARQADLFRDTLRRSAEYLSDLSHSVAYIGEIGVGKTTVICMQSGLVLNGADETGVEKIVLEFGRGGTTICEVRVVYHERFGLIVEPCPDVEIYRLVDDLCAGLWVKSEPEGDDGEQERGVPREIQRALRNMANLNRQRRKDPAGKSTTFDPAKKLLEGFNSLDDFQAEFSSRLQLWKRKRREVWYDLSDSESGLIWLRKIFAEINNGRNPDYPLPQRITVHVPSEVLIYHGYVLEIIDTKGVDRTAFRPDLQNCIDDTRTLTILCSRFTQAPDISLQGLIEHLANSGGDRALSERVAMLVLAHDTEALGMKDDSGVLAETEVEGYELRLEQVEAELTRIGASQLPVYFFNAKTEIPEDFTAYVVAQIVEMRDVRVQKIKDIATAVEQLIKNRGEQHALAAQQEVNNQLHIFARRHLNLEQSKRPAHTSVLKAIRSLHPSTVWATTRRSGLWPGLDVFFYLGAGSELDARQRSDGVIHGLKEVIQNMLGNNDLEPIHDFLNELLSAVDNWRDKFLKAVRQSGEHTYRPSLKNCDNLWSSCEDLYGQGLPYREKVAKNVQNWFESDKQEKLHIQLEKRITEAWRSEVIQHLSAITEEFAVESSKGN